MITALTDFEQKLIPLIKTYVNSYNEHKRLKNIIHPGKIELYKLDFHDKQVEHSKNLIEHLSYPSETFRTLYKYQDVYVIFNHHDEWGWLVSINDNMLDLDINI